MTDQPDQHDDSAESVYDKSKTSPFQPFEPEDVHPTSTAPPPELPEDVGGTTGEDDEATTGERKPEQQELPEFDERYRESFQGLLYVGRLSRTFTRLGHTFVIHTLTTEQMAEIALLVKPWDGTRAQNAVYQAAVVAAAVQTLDGERIVEPLGDSDDVLEAKFRYVMRSWMPPVREMIWNEVFDLEDTVRKVIEQMGNASG